MLEAGQEGELPELRSSAKEAREAREEEGSRRQGGEQEGRGAMSLERRGEERVRREEGRLSERPSLETSLVVEEEASRFW